MRRVISILLLLIFMSPFWLKSTLVLNWVVNNDFIANTLCEKRYDYFNDCQGVCYINKQLNMIDKQLSNHQPAEQSSSFVIVENLSPYFLDDLLSVTIKFSEVDKTLFSLEFYSFPSNPFKEIFHPPQFV